MNEPAGKEAYSILNGCEKRAVQHNSGGRLVKFYIGLEIFTALEYYILNGPGNTQRIHPSDITGLVRD